MNNQEAKLILQAYRCGGQDASDPLFAEALEQARRDPELAKLVRGRKRAGRAHPNQPANSRSGSARTEIKPPRVEENYPPHTVEVVPAHETRRRGSSVAAAGSGRVFVAPAKAGAARVFPRSDGALLYAAAGARHLRVARPDEDSPMASRPGHRN